MAKARSGEGHNGSTLYLHQDVGVRVGQTDQTLAGLGSQNSGRGTPRVDQLTSTQNLVSTAGEGSPIARRTGSHSGCDAPRG